MRTNERKIIITLIQDSSTIRFRKYISGQNRGSFQQRFYFKLLLFLKLERLQGALPTLLRSESKINTLVRVNSRGVSSIWRIRKTCLTVYVIWKIIKFRYVSSDIFLEKMYTYYYYNKRFQNYDSLEINYI